MSEASLGVATQHEPLTRDSYCHSHVQLKEKLDQDQTDTKVQIGAILDELKDKHSDFATQLDKLKK